MKNLYIVTGANGHLGSTLVRMLQRRGAEVRGLLLPQEQAASHSRVTYYHGDVREKESLRPLFEDTGDTRVTVIHTAGIIDISEHVSPLLYDVNVGGTRNMVELCEEYRVYRMVYVSSVHAIPEKDKNCVLHEVRHFSPNEVVGGYAKTKAEATQIVLDAADHGLNAVVVHPSGILGPYDRSRATIWCRWLRIISTVSCLPASTADTILWMCGMWPQAVWQRLNAGAVGNAISSLTATMTSRKCCAWSSRLPAADGCRCCRCGWPKPLRR